LGVIALRKILQEEPDSKQLKRLSLINPGSYLGLGNRNDVVCYTTGFLQTDGSDDTTMAAGIIAAAHAILTQPELDSLRSDWEKEKQQDMLLDTYPGLIDTGLKATRTTREEAATFQERIGAKFIEQPQKDYANSIADTLKSGGAVTFSSLTEATTAIDTIQKAALQQIAEANSGKDKATTDLEAARLEIAELQKQLDAAKAQITTLEQQVAGEDKLGKAFGESFAEERAAKEAAQKAKKVLEGTLSKIEAAVTEANTGLKNATGLLSAPKKGAILAGLLKTLTDLLSKK